VRYRRLSSGWLLFVAAASVVVAAGWAAAGRSAYVMRDLGTFGGTEAFAKGINDQGQVVIVRGTGRSQSAPAASARSLLWQDGRVRLLGTLAGGATAASAINGRGQVAGESIVNGVPHAFLWQKGTMRDIGAIGGNTAAAVLGTVALNDRAQVAGTRIGKSGPPPRAFRWQNGKMRDLGTLGKAFVASAAYGINARGQVVGVSHTTGGVMHPFLWQNGTMHDIATPTNGVRLIWAFAINDTGQVAALGGRTVGKNGVDENTIRAYLWSKGAITDLGSFSPTAINNRGQIVGTSQAKNGQQRGVLWQNGRITDLGGNPTGTTFAQAINDHGQIVGAAIINGHPHAILWTLKPGSSRRP
jgi:probable HAF family extracellular repeat protein